MPIKLNEEVARIINDNRLTKQEKVGHMRMLCNNGTPESLATLEQLLVWLTGERPPRFWGKFDPNTRVFQISFEPAVYFEGGGRQYHNKILQRMNQLGWPFISFQGADFWIGHFPYPEGHPMNPKPEVKQTKVEEKKEDKKPKERKPKGAKNAKPIEEKPKETIPVQVEEKVEPDLAVKNEPEVEKPAFVSTVVRRKAGERVRRVEVAMPVEMEDED